MPTTRGCMATVGRRQWVHCHRISPIALKHATSWMRSNRLQPNPDKTEVLWSHPSLCTVGHSSDVRDRTGRPTFPTGLWECCAGRPSGLPDAPTPLDAERGGTADLPSENLRPYTWCIRQVSTGCGSRVEYSTNLLFWRTKCCMATHHVTSVRLSMSMVYMVIKHSDLPAPTVLWHHQSNCQMLTAEPLRLLLLRYGMNCVMTSSRLIHC